MRLKAVPFSPVVGIHWGSDVERLCISAQGLVITIARDIDESQRVQGLEVTFLDASAFRWLDEVDLARYWISEDFTRGAHVLEVREGGWSDEENYFQGYETQRREWLVVTGNACVSVFCGSEPQIRSLEWQRGA